MERASILRKVRACLRLSRSANTHEAAAALRQAQKLMAEHDIEQADLDEADREAIGEASTERRGTTPPIYVVALMNLVSAMMGVETFTSAGDGRCRVVFVGTESRAAVASYAFTVLLRQLERDRRAYLSRVRKAANRAARGDVFGGSWVRGAREVLAAFVGVAKDERIDGYIARRYPGLKSVNVESRKSKAVSYGDVGAGRAAGLQAKLDRGVGGAGQRQLEHTP